jgi:hypothetical protein
MTEMNYLTVKQFAEKHIAFSESSLRFLIFNEKNNGLADSKVIARVGKRVLINEERFFNWLEHQNEVA